MEFTYSLILSPKIQLLWDLFKDAASAALLAIKIVYDI